MIQWNLLYILQDNRQAIKSYTNYKKADFVAFKELLSHVPWDQLKLTSSLTLKMLGLVRKTCFLLRLTLLPGGNRLSGSSVLLEILSI